VVGRAAALRPPQPVVIRFVDGSAAAEVHKLRNLWHSSEPGGMPCKCNTSATASGGSTG
jgi:hypothetical protein